MIDTSAASIGQVVIHHVGNKANGESFFLSEEVAILDDPIVEILLEYFLKPFNNTTETYHFHHDIDDSYHVLFNKTREGFADSSQFVSYSKDVTRHLFEQSNHHHIKSGDVFVVRFEDILYRDELVSAIGIFKSERKDPFIKLSKADRRILINRDQGISIKKLDKGCLLLNTDADDGYRILSVDNNNYDTDYWKRQFLGIQYIKDSNYETSNFIHFCKAFSEEVVKEKHDKKAQIDFLNQTVQFLDENESIDRSTFKDMAIQNDALRHDFEQYKTIYEQKHQTEIPDSFNLSATALKKEKRQIKSFIQLDTNVQIKINMRNSHSIDRFIEKGYDGDKQMHYYKIYFNTEK